MAKLLYLVSKASSLVLVAILMSAIATTVLFTEWATIAINLGYQIPHDPLLPLPLYSPPHEMFVLGILGALIAIKFLFQKTDLFIAMFVAFLLASFLVMLLVWAYIQSIAWGTLLLMGYLSISSIFYARPSNASGNIDFSR